MARFFCGEKTPKGDVGRELSPLSDERLEDSDQVLVPNAGKNAYEGAIVSLEDYRQRFKPGKRMLQCFVREDNVSGFQCISTARISTKAVVWRTQSDVGELRDRKCAGMRTPLLG